MSEPVQTLWFEDVGFFNEPMLDTPVGRFSIRQMCVFLVFGLFAWSISLPLEDAILKIAVAGAIFFAGAVTFTRKIKTIPPETHLLYIINFKGILQTKWSRKKQLEQQGFEERGPLAKSLILSATLGVPVKIVGVLKDSTSDQPLAGRSFNVEVDGVAYSKGFTDEEGFFCAYFVPDRFGTFKVEVKPEGFVNLAQQIRVKVNPKEVNEIADIKV